MGFITTSRTSCVSPRGFTLVEMSIVLVIIGLIASGVLVGQELVASARIRSQISQLGEFSQAIGAFRLKYDYLPGDIKQAKAAAYGLYSYINPIYAATSMDGDGVIRQYNGVTPMQDVYGEPLFLLYHLRGAGFIAAGGADSGGYYRVGVGSDFPPLSLDKSLGLLAFSWSDGKLVYYPGVQGSNQYNTHNMNKVAPDPPFTPATAFALDNKLDDGQPSTGATFAVSLSGNVLSPDTTDNACLTQAGTAAEGYYVTNNADACRLIIHASIP